MTERLFGTDGVRGVAGQHPLDRATVARLGAAFIRAVKNADGRPAKVLVGRDTRGSGPWIEEALATGVSSEGARLVSAGVLPTPAVALLTASDEFDGGLVISASHNPYGDNGIKLFGADGQKAGDRVERQVERAVADGSWAVPDGATGSIERRDFSDDYVRHAAAVLPEPERLASLRVVIDCANGATCEVGPRVFRKLGLRLDVLSDAPDGRNINLRCGSTAPAALARVVQDLGDGIGVAFDGDGDRAILIDEDGAIVDGDATLLVCATHLKAAGRLPGNTIVTTVMSNMGLEVALRRHGISVVRCDVGDKFVSEEMKARGIALGGEQSGHVILADHGFTGDGLLTALSVLRAMADAGRRLADLVSEFEVYPQVLVNVRVREKLDIAEIAAVRDVVASVEGRLADSGRLVVRYSGTEPLLRVMIEGRDETQIQTWADEIVGVVETHLGAGAA